MQVVINKSLRNILWIWWPRKMSNKELWRQTAGAATDRSRGKKKSLGMDWPHVKETRWTCTVVKRALEWNPQEKRKRGRLQHTWRRTKMAELERKHLLWNEAKGTAQNRARWRILVGDLYSTRNEED